MGVAPNWQAQVERELAELELTIFNPRRDEWDPSWRQSIDEPRFREQVEWELAALERATTIILYFDPQTRAPISLLEFGLFARSGKLLVCCPEGFWRRGNVEVVCARFAVPFVEGLEALIDAARERLRD